MDKIVLSGMEFFAYHGVLPEENKLGQKFSADLVLGLSLAEAGKQDDLSKTVNYAKAYEIIAEIMTGNPVQLIETLAERIAAALFEEFPLLEQVQVKITKPSAPIAGLFKDVAVEIERQRC